MTNLHHRIYIYGVIIMLACGLAAVLAAAGWI